MINERKNLFFGGFCCLLAVHQNMGGGDGGIYIDDSHLKEGG
jgi:hypothetical protein